MSCYAHVAHDVRRIGSRLARAADGGRGAHERAMGAGRRPVPSSSTCSGAAVFWISEWLTTANGVTSSPAICLKCGAEALGKYCSQCGEPLRAVCKACGTEAPPRSRFCPECGASFKGATAKKTPVASSSRNALVTPWTVAGGIGVVLAAVGAFLMLDQKSTPPPSSSAPAASRATTAPPDISSLSPGEAAEAALQSDHDGR